MYHEFPYTGVPSLVLSSTVVVTSGEAVCPNTSLEFTCVGVKVSFLDWDRNGMEIRDFNAGDSGQTVLFVHPFTVFLDMVTIVSVSSVTIANITSRLVVNISDLMSGDQISCSQFPIESSKNLSYTLRGNYATKYSFINARL